jgi:hypothetical protein
MIPGFIPHPPPLTHNPQHITLSASPPLDAQSATHHTKKWSDKAQALVEGGGGVDSINKASWVGAVQLLWQPLQAYAGTSKSIASVCVIRGRSC